AAEAHHPAEERDDALPDLGARGAVADLVGQPRCRVAPGELPAEDRERESADRRERAERDRLQKRQTENDADQRVARLAEAVERFAEGQFFFAGFLATGFEGFDELVVGGG